MERKCGKKNHTLNYNQNEYLIIFIILSLVQDDSFCW